MLKEHLSRLAPVVREALARAERSRRKQAEEAVTKAAIRCKLIISSAMDAIVSLDSQQRIVLFNPAAEKMFRIAATEAVGRSINDFLPERNDDREAFGRICAVERVGMMNALRADGEEFQVEASLSAAEIAGERILILILHDITARRRNEEAMRQTRAELGRSEQRSAQLAGANANLQTFADTAAHNLRAPLRSIQGFSGIIADEYGNKIGFAGRALLQRVTESAGQMDRLLKDLLEYSRMGQEDLKLEPVNLTEAVSETLALLDEDIQRTKAVVLFSKPLPGVIGHRATVVIIVDNLVSNALKYVVPGVQPQIHISGERSCDFVRLTIQDNGIGIADENLPRLFGVFQRLHGIQTYPGTGLGLAIVRKGIERMGGRVGVESDLGKGSRFWLELRAATLH